MKRRLQACRLWQAALGLFALLYCRTAWTQAAAAGPDAPAEPRIFLWGIERRDQGRCVPDSQMDTEVQSHLSPLFPIEPMRSPRQFGCAAPECSRQVHEARPGDRVIGGYVEALDSQRLRLRLWRSQDGAIRYHDVVTAKDPQTLPLTLQIHLGALLDARSSDFALQRLATEPEPLVPSYVQPGTEGGDQTAPSPLLTKRVVKPAVRAYFVRPRLLQPLTAGLATSLRGLFERNGMRFALQAGWTQQPACHKGPEVPTAETVCPAYALLAGEASLLFRLDTLRDRENLMLGERFSQEEQQQFRQAVADKEQQIAVLRSNKVALAQAISALPKIQKAARQKLSERERAFALEIKKAEEALDKVYAQPLLVSVYWSEKNQGEPVHLYTSRAWQKPARALAAELWTQLAPRLATWLRPRSISRIALKTRLPQGLEKDLEPSPGSVACQGPAKSLCELDPSQCTPPPPKGPDKKPGDTKPLRSPRPNWLLGLGIAAVGLGVGGIISGSVALGMHGQQGPVDMPCASYLPPSMQPGYSMNGGCVRNTASLGAGLLVPGIILGVTGVVLLTVPGPKIEVDLKTQPAGAAGGSSQ